ncbi:MAG: type I-A CRISPR-associated protein Cas5a [Nitrososphaeria archaeon]
MSFKAYRFTVEFQWGIISRMAGSSKTSPSYLFPPPTTVIGALAKNLAVQTRKGESAYRELFREILSGIYAISFKVINVLPSPYTDLSRVIAIGNRGGYTFPSPKMPDKSFDVPATGKVYYSSADGNPPRIEYALVFSEQSSIIKDSGSFIDSIWKINRLGTKESLVSVVDVKETEADLLHVNKEKTQWAFPKKLLKPKSKGSYKIFKHFWVEEYVDPLRLELTPPESFYSYEYRTPYVIPRPKMLGGEPLTFSIEAFPEYAVFKVKCEKEGEMIVGRKQGGA